MSRKLAPDEWHHGTRSTYINHECRCDACCAAESAYRTERRRQRRTSGDFEHGTRAGYWVGCLCDPCAAAGREARRHQDAKRREQLGLPPPRPRRHPMDHTCTCTACDQQREREARRADRELERRRRQAEIQREREKRAATRERRFDLDALQKVERTSLLELARRTNVHHRQLVRWRSSGLTTQQADELAVALGWHPWEVWGDRWWSSV